MPRKSTYTKSEVTRENIRRTALQLFSEKGYSKVTIQMICQACGVATGLFYYYFSSKEAIIEDSKKIGEPLFESLLLKANLSNQIGSYIREYFSIYAQTNIQLGTDLFMRITPDKGSSTEDAKARRTRLYLEEQIQLAQEHGEFQPDINAHTFVGQLFVYVRGVIIDWCLSSGSYDLDEAIQTMLTPFIEYYVIKK